MSKKKCSCCDTELKLVQIAKLERDYKITYNVLSIEEIKSKIVLETYFECPKCSVPYDLSGVKKKLFSVTEV